MTHPSRTVYLAGPISGLSYEDATFGWRAEIAKHLTDAPHISLLSPMRGKEFLKAEAALPHSPDSLRFNALSTPQGITQRDRNDVMTCDAMLAVFLGTEKASVGTCIEFGWADAFRKPVIMVIENAGQCARALTDDERQKMIGNGQSPPDAKAWMNPHYHGMMTTVAGFVVPTLEEAARILKTILTPGL